MQKDSDKDGTARIDYYDDKKHDYEDFWHGRDYEHLSEVIALKKLLLGQHFRWAVDLGGGYGRLCPTLMDYADKLTIIDPSKKQLDLGRAKFAKYPSVDFLLLESDDRIPLAPRSVDLLLMIRVTHHLIDPSQTFSEISRILKPGAKAIIEVANYGHALNRLKYYARFKRVPSSPVKVGRIANGLEDNTPFVNHNTKTIEAQLDNAGLRVIKKLSVSNLRSHFLKSLLGLHSRLFIEKHLQSSLAGMNFGPSIIYLLENNKQTS